MANKKEKIEDAKQAEEVKAELFDEPVNAAETPAQGEPERAEVRVESSSFGVESADAPSQPSLSDRAKGWLVSFGRLIKRGVIALGLKTRDKFVDFGVSVKDKCVAAKDSCVETGRTIKGWFVKDPPIDPNDPDAQMKSLLAGRGLSRKEKFLRSLRSQSGWLFVLPAVILLCIFTLYPIFNAFIRAFMENYRPLDVKNPYTGWGFENFVRVLKGDTGTGGANFWQCFLNTFIVTIVSVPLSILLALLIAVGLSSIKAVRKAYQTVLFLPYLTNALAMGAVFATFFQIIGTRSNTETVGIVNNFLKLFGIEPIYWLEPGKHAWGSGMVKVYWASYFVAIVYDVWAGLPFKILILFSALQSVNKQYYDAAKIDGASKTKTLVKITAPMISPMLSYLFITGIMGGMKAYSSIVGLFGVEMGKNYNMGTIVGYIYQYIDSGDTGFAFAGSLLLFFIIMLITAITNRVSKKRVTYS